MAFQRPNGWTVAQCAGWLREQGFVLPIDSTDGRAFETCAQHLLRLAAMEAVQAEHVARGAAMAARGAALSARGLLGAVGCISDSGC